jgi:L-iditol 2-dehydrogenase
MIAAQYTQGSGLSIRERLIPEIGRDELLLKVRAASICGTDTKIVNQGHRKLRPGQTVILGHEFSGVVERRGKEVANYPEGMSVGVVPNIGCGWCEMCLRGMGNMCPNYNAFGITLDGAHAEYVRIPSAAICQGLVVPLSEGLSPLDATLAEPVSCVVNALRTAKLVMGDSVLIYGAGPMGLLNLVVARVSGASQVFVVDVNDARLAKATELGATATCNSSQVSVKQWVAERTAARGLDVVVTAVPVRRLQAEALELLAPFGRLSIFAGTGGQDPVALDTDAIHYKSLSITGTTGGTPRDYRAALNLIASRRLPLRGIISHVLPIQEVGKAYDTALSGRALKVVMAEKDLIACSNGPSATQL